jgi:hypothetical protein
MVTWKTNEEIEDNIEINLSEVHRENVMQHTSNFVPISVAGFAINSFEPMDSVGEGLNGWLGNCLPTCFISWLVT